MESQIALHRAFADEHRGRAGHINIQHYAQLISDASEALTKHAGLDTTQPLFAEHEIVRFLGELHSGDEVVARAGFGTTHNSSISIVGDLLRTSDNRIIAMYQRDVLPWDTESQKQAVWKALPATPDHPLESNIIPIKADYAGSELNEYRITIDPQDASDDKIISARALWHIITEALWDVQTKFGAGQSELKGKGITGGATVIQLDSNLPVTCADVLSITTSAIGVSASSVRMEHKIHNASKGNCRCVTARYVVTFFNRKSGQRCPLSEVFPGENLYALTRASNISSESV